MLKQLRIENFKGWQDTKLIKMAPITLFFGANSSGKSSIGQFLMMLKQTVESPDRRAVFYPGGRNSAVQLGSYGEMVFRRDKTNSIKFEYRWDTTDDITIKDPITRNQYTGNSIDFKATTGILDKAQNVPVVEAIKYSIFKEDDNPVLSIGMEKKDKGKYKVPAKNYTLRRNQGRAWDAPPPIRFYGFPDEVVAYYQNAEFVQDLNLRHEQLFRRFSYLGPLRIRAERLYSWAGTEPESVGYFGENTIAAILAARDRRISLGYKKSQKPLEEIIAAKLREMGLIDQFSVNQISRTRQEYEVKVLTKGSPDFVDLPDVGVGVSQVLPVLTQLFYAPAGSIIIMEQPEIHLHPSAQSALADVMIDAIHSRENGEDRNIQLIIETHSEHFLRRLQRRIAEEVVKQEKVAAYFADTTRTPAQLEPLQIDAFGNITNWPDNFFGDEMGDIIAQSRAAVDRRIKEKDTATDQELNNE